MIDVPRVSGRSSAQQFLEDHDHLERELMLKTDECTALKDQVNQLSNMVSLQAKEMDKLHGLIARERARGDQYQRYTVAMSSHLTAVDEAIKRARQMGLEASQETVQSEADEKVTGMTQDARDRLTSLVTRLAPNQL